MKNLLMYLLLISTLIAGTATDIQGLYYTGLNSNSGLQNPGTQEAHWEVTYASTNGGVSENTQYEGMAYVMSSQYAGGNYVSNTSSAQWITAPNAVTSSGITNAGGVYLPGNGNAYGNNSSLGIYIYTLAFNIIGSGRSVSNSVKITLTVAADDNVKLYVNPVGNGQYIPIETAALEFDSAWSNTAVGVLANYTSTDTTNNATFKIGTNYLVAVVENTNNKQYSSTDQYLNASGFMLYQNSAGLMINNKVVPETWTWLPMVGAFTAYGLIGLRKKN